jgi:D-3-phosphoglycerate dehydrogenase
MTERWKVVVADYDYGDLDIECGILEPIGARVVGLQAKHEEDLIPEVADCDAVINQYARVGLIAIGAMTRCKVIARYGIGVDIVDVEAATKRGILVTNVRDYCTEEVADHAIALWLSLVRKLPAYDRSTHQGVWHWQAARPVYRVRDRVMGIVSFGRIGRAIAARAIAFGPRLIAYDPNVKADEMARYGVTCVSKDELLSQSDYIVMQAPMTPETRHFLSDDELSRVKPGVIIVNTGRGPTIDNKALYKALVDGRVSGAGLDDPEEEPAKRAHWTPAGNPIFSLPNVIVTPHVAYYSEESILTARRTAAGEVARVLTGKPPRFPVNAGALMPANMKGSS